MQDNKSAGGWTPPRARKAIAAKRAGLSFAEIAKDIAEEGFTPSRSAVCGFFARLRAEHEQDARDIKICDELAMKTHSIDTIARTHSVTVDHVRDLKREAGL